jgi:hypothetical protein
LDRRLTDSVWNSTTRSPYSQKLAGTKKNDRSNKKPPLDIGPDLSFPANRIAKYGCLKQAASAHEREQEKVNWIIEMQRHVTAVTHLVQEPGQPGQIRYSNERLRNEPLLNDSRFSPIGVPYDENGRSNPLRK